MTKAVGAGRKQHDGGWRRAFVYIHKWRGGGLYGAVVRCSDSEH